MTLQPQTLFHDRYFLQEMKGRGSFGEVWLARDTKLDIDVAVKVYIALDSRGVEEFKTEFRTAFGLNHPNLLHAHHFDICEDRPYLVMPYCPNSALNLIGNIDEATLWRFVRDVASGLEYLHSLGIIHHDIKPDNVLIDEEGKFLITDFGISVKFRSTLRRNSARQVETENKSKGGSIPYMAPEMFGEKPEAVNNTDIWALGVTMYEMMTGELPFFGQGGAMQQNGAKVPEVPGDWSDNLKKVVMKCLEPLSWDRPSAHQLVTYAQAAIDGEKDIFNSHQGQAKANPKTKWVIIGLVVALLAVGGIVGYSSLQAKKAEAERIEKERAEKERINNDYADMERQCLDMIGEGSNSETEPWLKAKKQIDRMRLYEKEYGERIESLVSDSLQSLLDVRLKGASEAWAGAAERQASLGEDYKALELYKAALDLYESPELRQTYNELKEKTIIVE